MKTKIDNRRQVTDGPVYRVLRLSGTLGNRRPINFLVTATHFKPASLLKVEITLHNPRRAEHAGGFWDLGDPQSELLESATLALASNLDSARTIRWSEQSDDVWSQTSASHWSLTQLNSGGERWKSRSHLNSRGEVLEGTRGYQVAYQDVQKQGLRATPTVELHSLGGRMTTTMLDFWQKFPSEFAIDRSTLLLHIFPRQQGQHVELQAGEQTTRTLWVQLDGPGSPPIDLAWVHSPLTAVPLPTRLQKTDGLEWVAAARQSPHPDKTASDEDKLLEEMLSGDGNFFWKREQVDEYGWRNFGDFWADHEEQYADDSTPVISHYNNQYDLLHGLLRQYLRTQDRRWWELARPLAEHVIDIDIYHTKRDRAAYNGGLFWHTSHYRDASTCTHRSFSKQMIAGKHSVAGGGPSNEHNYTSGLLLYYHLTGCQKAKDAVLSLADLVLAMDDGRQSVLAPLSSLPTGNASSTSARSYHGPGRGVGNSINALIDAWQVTRSSHYLDKCRELIRRAVHPEEDIESLNLLDAEMRWSYTVALQALARYEFVVGPEDAETAAYIRASLIRYGRWMQQHEQLYLDDRDQLEFPTETWPAQDMRKGTTLMLISAYLDPPQREAMYRAGSDLFDRAKQQLQEFSTRCCTRPAAIALQQFPMASIARAADRGHWVIDGRSEPITRAQWKAREPLCTQKQDIKSKLRSPLGVCQVALSAMRPMPWLNTIPETPLGRWMRR